MARRIAPLEYLVRVHSVLTSHGPAAERGRLPHIPLEPISYSCICLIARICSIRKATSYRLPGRCDEVAKKKCPKRCLWRKGVDRRHCISDCVWITGNSDVIGLGKSRRPP